MLFIVYKLFIALQLLSRQATYVPASPFVCFAISTTPERFIWVVFTVRESITEPVVGDALTVITSELILPQTVCNRQPVFAHISLFVGLSSKCITKILQSFNFSNTKHSSNWLLISVNLIYNLQTHEGMPSFPSQVWKSPFT